MHVPHLRQLATKEGKPTGGAFGVVKSLRSTIATWPEIRRVVMVLDGSHSKRRKDLLPGYKVRVRKDDVDPDGLTYFQKFNLQLKYLKFILPRLGVKVVQLDREGDDTIGLLSNVLDDKLKLVVSDDRDMYQLITDDVHVWRPIAEERVSLQNFEQSAKCKREHFLLRKAVLGDSSDKIPGIKGVGAKTVDKVLDACDDIGPYPHDNFFDTALSMKGKKIQSIPENLDIVLRNYKLVDISLEKITEEETAQALDAVNAENRFDVLAVKRFFTGLEFFSLIENFSYWVTPFQMLK